jgi:hypothetical protein
MTYCPVSSFTDGKHKIPATKIGDSGEIRIQHRLEVSIMRYRLHRLDRYNKCDPGFSLD